MNGLSRNKLALNIILILRGSQIPLIGHLIVPIVVTFLKHWFCEFHEY